MQLRPHRLKVLAWIEKILELAPHPVRQVQFKARRVSRGIERHQHPLFFMHAQKSKLLGLHRQLLVAAVQ